MEQVRGISSLAAPARSTGGGQALAFRNLAAIVGAVLSVALSVGAARAPLARAADTDVSIVDFAFQPATVTVAAGGTVTWTVTRAQEPHTVSPVDPPDGFEASSLLRQGDRYAVTFAAPGTYRYECTIHPEDMRGTVVVVAAPTASPTASATPTPTPAPTVTPSTSPPSPGSTTPSPAGGNPSPDGALAPAFILLLVLLGTAAFAGAWLVARVRRSGP